MKLYYDRKSKNPTYFIQAGYRHGNKVTTKNIQRIGKHNDLLSITDNPLEFAKQKVKEYNESIKNEKVTYTVNIDFNEKIINQGDIISKSLCKNTGYFYLKDIYDNLGLDKFFDKVCKGKKITYNPNLINMVLTMFRIIDPGSKLHTYNHLNDLYGCFDSIHKEDIYRFMDILTANYDAYIEHLFDKSNNIIKRNTSVCYFDCTNFYFEKEEEEEDYYDDVTGELIIGLLKYGISKEHRPNPIVQMGLFMDGDGIPLTMCVNPGNQNESLCAVPTEKKMLNMFENKDIIYCSDAGLGYSDTRVFNSFANRKFVVTQSIKKLSEPIKQAIFNDYDYRFSGNKEKLSLEFMKTFDRKNPDNRKYYDGNVYKSIEVDSNVDLGLTEYKKLKNGKTRKVKSKAVLKQRIIVTYSRKAAEYQKNVRNRQIERAEKLLKTMDPETFKKGPNDVTRFIKSDKKKTTYYLDSERIEEEAKYDGFYAVATNIFDMSENEIIEIQSRRYQIEDCFRIMKTNLDGRPIFHWTDPRIVAHFLICYTALLIYRLLEVKLDRNGTHFTTSQIIETLKNMEVVNCSDVYYQACYTGSKTLDALEQIFDLKLDKKYYEPKKLNKLSKI